MLLLIIFLDLWKDEEDDIEGASQRIQEDCFRWSRILEHMGSEFVSSILTLIAFIPVLWKLSEGTVIGGVTVHGFYVWLGLASAIIGVGFSFIIGRKLPHLEFENQKVEAAFRKDLVLAEDDRKLVTDEKNHLHKGSLKINYFKLFAHFFYFRLWQSWYNTIGNIVPFIFAVPISLIPGLITFGALMQIARAFDNVHASFSFLINNWTSVTELQSVYMRLRAFEKRLKK